MMTNNNEIEMNLNHIPNEKSLHGTQKCYIGLEALHAVSGQIGSYISISTLQKEFFCSLWPARHNLANSIQYDGTVFRRMAAGMTSSISVSKDIILKPVKSPSHAVSVSVSLVLNKVHTVRQCKQESFFQQKFQTYCKNCLLNFSFPKQAVLDLCHSKLAKRYGIAYILVNDFTTVNNCELMRVNKSTSVTVDGFMSKALFKQKSDAKDVKIGGLDDEVNKISDLISFTTLVDSDNSENFMSLPKGILLRGPPGCGKTSLVQHVAQISSSYLITVNGCEIFSPHPGESEEKLRQIFDEAVLMSSEGKCILFFDEIDSLCPQRDRTSGHSENRITGQMLSLMDSLQLTNGLLVIGATNRSSALDPALRRPGRFDREILINVPQREQRRKILEIHLSQYTLSGDVELDHLAEITTAYVGADIVALCHEAAYTAMMDNLKNSVNENIISMRHFKKAFNKIVPSLQRGAVGSVDLKPVQWNDIGGYEDVKLQIKQCVEWPLKHPEAFQRMGLPSPKGVLLYGPPGCCKTTLVRAVATSCHVTFLSLNGAQVYSPYVGESEKLIAEIFQKARVMAPSILFLDEIDSLVGKRSDSKSHKSVQERILSTLLNEMDGIGIRLDEKAHNSSNKPMEEGNSIERVSFVKNKTDLVGVFVVAATNRPDLLDDALLRPGRIDRMVYVPPPDLEARKEIIGVHTKKMPVHDIEIDEIAANTDFYSGADIENICREAALLALTEEGFDSAAVDQSHFDHVIKMSTPSIEQGCLLQYQTVNTQSHRKDKLKSHSSDIVFS